MAIVTITDIQQQYIYTDTCMRKWKNGAAGKEDLTNDQFSLLHDGHSDASRMQSCWASFPAQQDCQGLQVINACMLFFLYMSLYEAMLQK